MALESVHLGVGVVVDQVPLDAAQLAAHQVSPGGQLRNIGHGMMMKHQTSGLIDVLPTVGKEPAKHSAGFDGQDGR